MFQGQYLFYNESVYSPWMERGGDSLRITADLIGLTTDSQLEVQVVHKNRETAGNGTPTGSTLTLTSVGQDVGEYSGLLELVRYRITAGYDGTGASTDYVLFRMLSPVWFDAVDAS